MSLSSEESSSPSEKRLRLIESYLHATTTTLSTSNSQSSMFEDQESQELDGSQFTARLLALTRDQLDPSSDDGEKMEVADRLLETGLRYALAYLEEYDYSHKLTGLRLLDHMIERVSSTRIKMNMRAELVRDSLARYVNDKDSIEFLDKSNELMIKLLGKYYVFFFSF